MRQSKSYTSFDPQLSSHLIRAPYDIRREILSYLIPNGIHLFNNAGHLRFSECVGCIPADKLFPGQERLEGLPAGDADKFVRERRYAQRLMSSWGPHWTCEELVRMKDMRSAVDALVRSCKKL